MVDEEGTRGAPAKAASADPSDSSPRPKSDGEGDASPASPSPSRYSSCGESEFERYCSANSVMGTPSICSTVSVFNDCVDSELFGSMRSDSGLENFSLGGRFDRNQEDTRPSGLADESSGDRNVEFCEVNMVDEEARLKSGASRTLELYDTGELDISHEMIALGVASASDLVVGFNDDSVEGGHSEDEDEDSIGFREDGKLGAFQGSVERNLYMDRVGMGSSSRSVGEGDGSCYDRLSLLPDFQFDKMDTEREEEGTSSRYEHSEGEDSMYKYGTDDECKDHLFVPRDMHHVREAKVENENPLLMNSSVAFGSEDWDDFVQEMEGGTQASLTLDEVQDQKEHIPNAERNLQNSNFESLIGVPSAGQLHQGQVVADMPLAKKQDEGDYALANDLNICSLAPNDASNLDRAEQIEDVRDHVETSYQVQGVDKLGGYSKNTSMILTGSSDFNEPEQEDLSDTTVTNNQVRAADKSERFANTVLQMELEQPAEKVPVEMALNIVDGGMERGHQFTRTDEVTGIENCQVLENRDLGNSKENLELFDIATKQYDSQSTVSPKNINMELFEDHENMLISSGSENKMTILTDPPVSADLSEGRPTALQSDNLDISEFYDEVVHEMEEILLDSGKTPEARFSHDNTMFQSQLFLPLRDGGSTASTSGIDDSYPLIHHSLRIDGVEVVGARQKKGDISFSERLVGVKEYTVYKIRVWSGKDQWEVERRYRDFFTLYCQLKTLFAAQGWILPSPWSSVEKESRKIFGNASPNVISERSDLIQDCLRSILHSRLFSRTPSALVLFLSPQNSFPSSPLSNTLVHQSTSFASMEDTKNISTLGETISLIVEIHPYKSMKQMVEAQHYTCAGCHKHFDDGKTLMRDFVQSFGWGKPRLCEYSGQLYCSSCHINETAVLPARVLHHWDFTLYPVSQLAKSYLDSIHDQPMLCVSAVNPFLFSKVPALLHVMGVRKKIGTMLPYVRCPFRRAINKGLGSRRYLLESNDFFALRDLIDLSRGAFAALPVMVETVSNKIMEHITEQCLICCDVGVPCGARQACNDPSALIFPFQEGEVESCTSCKSLFHKPCFEKLSYCSCGVQIRVEGGGVSYRPGGEGSRALGLLGRRSNSGLSLGLFSGLFAKAKPEKMEHKDSDNVILMGSLPSTSL